MALAICSIQRNRGRWLHEWIAFHNLVGFDVFYIYLHKCTDNSHQVASALARIYNLKINLVPSDIDRPQLWAYNDCYKQNSERFEWIAFLDGDEFLFCRNGNNIKIVLEEFSGINLSGIGVYWACFGSSGHILEPNGLIIENYTHRADNDFSGNSHIKSIIKGGGGEEFSILNDSHFFKTKSGTYDTALRKITHGHTHLKPVYDKLIINHYATQSYQFFKEFKQHSGAADANPLQVRGESWWNEYDVNEVFDRSILSCLPYLKERIRFDELKLPELKKLKA